MSTLSKFVFLFIYFPINLGKVNNYPPSIVIQSWSKTVLPAMREENLFVLREAFNKKKNILFMEFSIRGGGVYPFSINFVKEKNIVFQKIFKDVLKLLIHPEM